MRTALIRSFVPVAVAALVLAGCGDDDDDATPAATPTTPAAVETTTTAAPTTTSGGETSGEATLALASNETIGADIVVDSEGRTLYSFSADSSADASSCSDACADAWPPATVTGEATVGDGLDEAKLTTFERDDGTTQVAYGGHPLYRYANDSAPGDANGQGVGDAWWVVGAAGNEIDDTGGDDG
jgi:predicted lipoprotein with Yx(FWY)xxD motif